MFAAKLLGSSIITTLNKSWACGFVNTLRCQNIHSYSSPLYFRITPCLLGEPLKKKKRIDPQILRAREERKRKKIEKQIRRLEKTARQLKPVDECEVPLEIVNDTKGLRKRPAKILSEAEVDERCVTLKSWAHYKLKESLADVQMLDRMLYSQQRALDELRKESEELYQEAIQLDVALLPFKFRGPVLTPPIKDYDSPDGEYIDISKKWT